MITNGGWVEKCYPQTVLHRKRTQHRIYNICINKFMVLTSNTHVTLYSFTCIQPPVTLVHGNSVQWVLASGLHGSASISLGPLDHGGCVSCGTVSVSRGLGCLVVYLWLIGNKLWNLINKFTLQLVAYHCCGDVRSHRVYLFLLSCCAKVHSISLSQVNCWLETLVVLNW